MTRSMENEDRVIHDLSVVGDKTQKIDWPLGGVTYQKIYKKIKFVEKYSLSYWYYGFYSYLQPFGRKTQKSDWPLDGVTYQKKLAPKNPEKYSLSYCYNDFYSYLEPLDHNQQMSFCSTSFHTCCCPPKCIP